MGQTTKVVLGAVILGFLEAACGAYKDTLFEEFDWSKFFRSPILTGISGLVVSQVWKAAPVPLLSIAAVSLERLSVEAWKAVIRQPPGKFNRMDRDTGWAIERAAAFNVAPSN